MARNGKSQSRLQAKYLKLQGLFTDKQTGLSSTLYHLDDLRSFFDRTRAVGIVYLSISNLPEIERERGWQFSDALLAVCADALRGVVQELRCPRAILSQRAICQQEFLLFLPELPGGAEVRVEGLDAFAGRATEQLRKRLPPGEGGAPAAELACGYSVLLESPFVRFERMVYQGIEEAKGMAAREGERERMRRGLVLKQIIREENISTIYQPIHALRDLRVIGFEALTRGPRDGPFEGAESLFAASEEHELSAELDDLCRRKILRSVPAMGDGLSLFINILPDSVLDPRLRLERFFDGAGPAHLRPDQIVLEIGERSSLGDAERFRARVEAYRGMGFRFALDDIGTGYSSLHAISEIRPDFLKTDISLTRGIDRSPVKQELMKTLVDMATRIRGRIIAEGIERAEELGVLRDHGVELGQGYFFGAPLAEPGRPAAAGRGTA